MRGSGLPPTIADLLQWRVREGAPRPPAKHWDHNKHIIFLTELYYLNTYAQQCYDCPRKNIPDEVKY